MTGPLRIVALLFPNVTQLDLTAPAQVFSRYPDAELDVVWRNTDPVPTDCGFSISPTCSLQDAPQADVLFVPGGQGAFDLFEDQEALDFIRQQAEHARYVTSVCTGSFVLAAAGLLKGRRVTSHWASLHLLERFGAVPTASRVVQDGRFVTGAGITSGIDFSLTLAAEIYGEAVAKELQLDMEYDPAPPFDAGAPTRPDAPPEEVESRVAAMTQLREPLIERFLSRVHVSGQS